MQPHLNLTTSSSKENNINQTSNFKIVGNFSINDSCFLVIYLEEFTKEEQKITLDPTLDTTSFLPLGYFEFEGKQYLIVKTENTFESGDPTLTNLLTGRELQIAALVAIGWSNKQVGHQLHISEWTVSAHLRRIFIKLNVDSRAAMVYRCSSLINQIHELGTLQQLKSVESQFHEEIASSNGKENF